LAHGNRSKPPLQRTDDERERDREERARRRAGPAASESQDAPAAAAPAAPAGGTPEDSPAVAVPPAVQESTEVQQPPPPVEEPAQIPPIPEPVEDPLALTSQSRPLPPERRDALLEQRRHRLRTGRPSLGRISSRGGANDGSRGGGRGGEQRLTRARAGALLALAVAIIFMWFLLSLFQPSAGSGHGRVIVEIPKGSSSSKIGSILARDGVVSSGFFFDVRALLAGKRSSLHSGRFQLKRDMSYSAAIDALSKPPPKVIAVKVVIPEGYTRHQISDLVAEDALTGDYLSQTKRSALLDPAHYGAPASTPDLEGFLFPATYDLAAGASVKRLVDEQLTAFRQRFTSADRRRARELHVTPYQLLTVASMIEREAQTEHDRPRIAAVIYNRLHEGIPLGIDATIYYAVEQQKGIATYTGELTESQLKIDSPYNTRTHKGLPPTPISNPGEASISAAARPSHVPYLYYVAGADGCGEQVFSKTYAEFEKNVAAYDSAVKQNGGHPPVCKKK
jgi:UPF0755 protein